MDDDGVFAEIGDLYSAIMAALDGASADTAQSALAMAILMTGEYGGLEGPALLAWIDETATAARIAAHRMPSQRLMVS
jgi:hypothetical protein